MDDWFRVDPPCSPGIAIEPIEAEMSVDGRTALESPDGTPNQQACTGFPQVTKKHLLINLL
jgi:hypothetical protein